MIALKCIFILLLVLILVLSKLKQEQEIFFLKKRKSYEKFSPKRRKHIKKRFLSEKIDECKHIKQDIINKIGLNGTCVFDYDQTLTNSDGGSY